MTNEEQFSATALKRHSSHCFSQNPACLRMMKGKNRLGQDYKPFLAPTTATFQHASYKQRDYHNPTDTYYKPPSAISLYRPIIAVNFACKLQQHFPVDNTDIEILQWNSNLAHYKQYNQAMLRSLQNFTERFDVVITATWKDKTNELYHFKTADVI